MTPAEVRPGTTLLRFGRATDLLGADTALAEVAPRCGHSDRASGFGLHPPSVR